MSNKQSPVVIRGNNARLEDRAIFFSGMSTTVTSAGAQLKTRTEIDLPKGYDLVLSVHPRFAGRGLFLSPSAYSGQGTFKIEPYVFTTRNGTDIYRDDEILVGTLMRSANIKIEVDGGDEG